MLFRKEAFEARSKKWSGKAVLLTELPGYYIVIFTVAFFLLFFILITEFSYTRRVNVYGEITSEPRAITLFSTQPGYIENCLVKPGQEINKSQPLCSINVSHTTSFGTVNIRHRESIEKRIDTLKHIEEEVSRNRSITLSMLKEEKERYELALQHSTDAVNHAREGLRLMKENMDNYRQYQKQGLINRDQLINQTALYYQQQNDILGLDTQNAQNALQVLTLRSAMQTQASDFDNQLHQISIQKSALEGELADADAGGDQVIISPVSGIVDTLSVSPGQSVSSGDSLIQIIPATAHYRQLILWVPDSAVLYLSAGQRVNIRYDAFPSEKFGQFPGKIFSVAHSPASWQEMATYSGSPSRSDNGAQTWYKVIVTPDSDSFHYKNSVIRAENGMRASVTLFLDERKLYQWIFSPIYDIRDSAMGLTHE